MIFLELGIVFIKLITNGVHKTQNKVLAMEQHIFGVYIDYRGHHAKGVENV
jgi:hypothetical protein